MRTRRHLVPGAVATAALLLAACGGVDEVSVATGSPSDMTGTTVPATAGDTFTPVTVTPLGPVPQPVLGTDGLHHVVYELQFTNTKGAPATLERVDVLDAASPDEPIISYEGQDLVGRLVTTQPRHVELPVIEVNGSRLMYIELAFADLAEVPAAVEHRVQLLGAANPGPVLATPLTYTVATIELSSEPVPVLGPPVAGEDWVAVNGCCLGTVIHRGSFASVNGGLFDAQRFAIDWMRLSPEGELVHGDPTVAENYPAYGADVIAVADATVVATLERLDDQVPGTLPNPEDITIETVDGNHVVLDLGNGRYAFYAHLQKDSVPVQVGDQVKRGDLLGKLGNSGNTSGPHLHFHVMDRPSVLGSEGVPYVIDDFVLTGQIDADRFAASPGVEGMWLEGPRPAPVPQHEAFPLNLNVLDLP